MLESTQGVTTTTAILIANPTSGSYSPSVQQQIEETITFLQTHGWQVELKLTKQAGDARKLAREAVTQHIHVVVAVGGDGTINEIIQELAGSETALGVLPNGTVNVWAREVGIPLNNAEAKEILLHGQVRTIDLGKVDDRYFLLMVGIGFDGEITHTIEKKPMKRLGVLGYLFIGTWLGLGYPAFSSSLEIDQRVIKINALQIVIGNTQLYAGAVKCTWLAKCDDGLLDICIIRKQNMFRRILVVIDFLLRRPRRHQWIRYETSAKIKIHTRRPQAIQVDGEPVDYTDGAAPTIVTVVPQALKVIVPQKLPEELFATR